MQPITPSSTPINNFEIKRIITKATEEAKMHEKWCSPPSSTQELDEKGAPLKEPRIDFIKV